MEYLSLTHKSVSRISNLLWKSKKYFIVKSGQLEVGFSVYAFILAFKFGICMENVWARIVLMIFKFR